MRRPVALLVATLALLASGAGPALAAGTGGIEVTPVVDGEFRNVFRVDVPSSGSEQVPFLLRNIEEDGPRTARLYAVEVLEDGDDLRLGEPGSSRHVELPDETVTLAAGETQERAFTLRGGELPEGPQLAAVVVEVRNGAVVQRASTLVYLGEGRRVPLPLLLVGLAVVLLAAAGVAVAVVARRRSAVASA